MVSGEAGRHKRRGASWTEREVSRREKWTRGDTNERRRMAAQYLPMERGPGWDV